MPFDAAPWPERPQQQRPNRVAAVDRLVRILMAAIAFVSGVLLSWAF